MTRAAGFPLGDGGRLGRWVSAPEERPYRRRFLLVGAALLIGWLPLVLLTTAAGDGQGGMLPLWSDAAAWVRALVLLPVLVLAEPWVDRYANAIVAYIHRARLVEEAGAERWSEALSAGSRRVRSGKVEAVLVLVAVVTPHLFDSSLVELLPRGVPTWYVDGQGGLTAAGRWYAWVAMPIVRFLMLRWAFRIAVWTHLMWRLSRLPLALVPGHPDRMGGLEILGFAPVALLPVFVAFSAQAAGGSTTLVRLGLVELPALGLEVAAFILCGVVVLLAPRFFFVGQAMAARRGALVALGATAAEVSRAYQARWSGVGPNAGEDLLDSNDSSSMADFAGSYDLVRGMRVIGVTPSALLMVVLPLAAPFAPLLLLEYSFSELVQRVAQMLFL